MQINCECSSSGAEGTGLIQKRKAVLVAVTTHSKLPFSRGSISPRLSLLGRHSFTSFFVLYVRAVFFPQILLPTFLQTLVVSQFIRQKPVNGSILLCASVCSDVKKIHPSIHYLPIHLPPHSPVSSSLYPPAHLTSYQSTYSYARPSIYLCMHPSVCLSIHERIRL